MQNVWTYKKTVMLLLMLSVFLMGAGNGVENGDERDALMDRQKTLQGRIETLRHEQDLLLFQKEMYTADSKYLVLNIAERTGQLRYKNRVLKDLQYTVSKSASIKKLRTGVLVLTKKREGKSSRHTLVFGKDLIIQRKNAAIPTQEADTPSLFLTKKDMQSVFFALEAGARIYIVK